MLLPKGPSESHLPMCGFLPRHLVQRTDNVSMDRQVDTVYSELTSDEAQDELLLADGGGDAVLQGALEEHDVETGGVSRLKEENEWARVDVLGV